MTKTVDIQEAERHLLELVTLAAQGQDVIIARDEKPLARLVSISGCKTASSAPRTPGLGRGAVKWISSDFDEPLPDELWTGTNENHS